VSRRFGREDSIELFECAFTRRSESGDFIYALHDARALVENVTSYYRSGLLGLRGFGGFDFFPGRGPPDVESGATVFNTHHYERAVVFQKSGILKNSTVFVA